MGLAKLCGWFGITRQAYYQNTWKASDISIEESLILDEVHKIRRNHTRMGTRKLYAKLQPFMQEHGIKMGRDALFDLLSANNLLVRNRKRKVTTTNSFHWLRKYPNLIRDFVPVAPNQLWVSDITYWKIKSGHVYISFVTDVFSHKIVGYHVAETLESVETIKALKMALSDIYSDPASCFELIHHSDRGVQYCQHNYVKLLKDNKVKISMTENGDPLENAVAERINGIMKDEYLLDKTVKDIKQAKRVLKEVVSLYNEDRPHNSIENHVPNYVHESKLVTKKLWNNYYKRRDVIETVDC
ncbi:IS3 family transposase [Marinilabiliaceae bacterium AAT]|uniref:IS3 family transposase n=1 Tax=Plebeiibacterium sediminum TaxID=2992112 RepID=A0AAE3M4W9_9BACT|nr:IS3 family transposase [Plebeiobacterium sediminum]MCW3786897.1 IS3 family transposase [Plebeiobacterium sediminum]